MMMLFDFDGTLCDDFRDAIEILNHICEDSGFRGVTSENLSSLRKMGARQVIRELGIPFYRLPDVTRSARQQIQERLSRLHTFPGMRDVIIELSTHIRLAIVTSNSEENVRSFLVNHEMNVFEFILAGSSIFGKKKKLINALSRAGLKQSSAIYVGDEARDIEAAKAVGLRCAAVSWGFQDKAVLQSKSPEWLLESPSQLLELRSKIFT